MFENEAKSSPGKYVVHQCTSFSRGPRMSGCLERARNRSEVPHLGIPAKKNAGKHARFGPAVDGGGTCMGDSNQQGFRKSGR